jgi:hypothetical protein
MATTALQPDPAQRIDPNIDKTKEPPVGSRNVILRNVIAAG